jgi:hypothetical protein
MFRGYYRGLTVGAFVCEDGHSGKSLPFNQNYMNTNQLVQKASEILKANCSHRELTPPINEENGRFPELNTAHAHSINSLSCGFIHAEHKVFRFYLSEGRQVEKLEYSVFYDYENEHRIHWILRNITEDGFLPLTVPDDLLYDIEICHQLIHDLFSHPGFQILFGVKGGVSSTIFQELLQ